MKYRLVKETENNGYTFWKVQAYYGWFWGWASIPVVNAVTCNEQLARTIFDKVAAGEPMRKIEVIQEITI